MNFIPWIFPTAASLILLTASLLQTTPTGDWISFLLDKGGLTAFAALALYMLRQSYSDRLTDQVRYREELARLTADKEQLRDEFLRQIQKLHEDKTRESGDFREELATLHQIVLSALTNNTQAMTEFATRVEACPLVTRDSGKK